MRCKIGDNIRYFRKLKGLTQSELADAVGISLMSVRRYEGNERIPPEALLAKIAGVLDTDRFRLYGVVSSSEVSFQDVMEYTGLSEKALYTITNGIRTFPGIDCSRDTRTLLDVLNLVLSDSTDFLVMLSFIRRASHPPRGIGVWGNVSAQSVQEQEEYWKREKEGYIKAASDILEKIVEVLINGPETPQKSTEPHNNEKRPVAQPQTAPEAEKKDSEEG